MKEIDWIPYLTTRMVDDAASHLRLYRQARAKMKQSGQTSQLEGIFFDLELTMEDNQSCRDHVCTDPESEKSEIVSIIKYNCNFNHSFNLIIVATVFTLVI